MTRAHWLIFGLVAVLVLGAQGLIAYEKSREGSRRDGAAKSLVRNEPSSISSTGTATAQDSGPDPLRLIASTIDAGHECLPNTNDPVADLRESAYFSSVRARVVSEQQIRGRVEAKDYRELLRWSGTFAEYCASHGGHFCSRADLVYLELASFDQTGDGKFDAADAERIDEAYLLQACIDGKLAPPQ